VREYAYHDITSDEHTRAAFGPALVNREMLLVGIVVSWISCCWQREKQESEQWEERALKVLPRSSLIGALMMRFLMTCPLRGKVKDFSI
jgi:hypothetical protein